MTETIKVLDTVVFDATVANVSAVSNQTLGTFRAGVDAYGAGVQAVGQASKRGAIPSAGELWTGIVQRHNRLCEVQVAGWPGSIRSPVAPQQPHLPLCNVPGDPSAVERDGGLDSIANEQQLPGGSEDK